MLYSSGCYSPIPQEDPGSPWPPYLTADTSRCWGSKQYNSENHRKSENHHFTGRSRGKGVATCQAYGLLVVDHQIDLCTRLGDGRSKLALARSAGDPCTMRRISLAEEDKSRVSLVEEDKLVALLILENSPEVQDALRTGRLEQIGYPAQSVYYTPGQPGQIRVQNHLDCAIYAAVSGPINTDKSFAQWPILPNCQEYWNRSSDEFVHLSLSDDCIGGQTAKVFQGLTGKVLHVKSLPSTSTWQGQHESI